MKKRLAMLLFGLLLSVGAVLAQNKVSGTVVSQEDGEPIIGASVKVKGSTMGVTTNIDGKFTITVKDGQKLEFSYIGMKSVTMTPKNGMKVTLASDATMVEEVVVTGIQKMDKRLFTGATTKIDAEKTKLDGVADVSRALEGRAAGVSVQNVSGTFGTAPKIRVRGATSIYGSSSPLWVVDGVILESAVKVSADDLSSGDAVTLISNAIAGLNADDIESFQVLKDGSATSIYGARAMSGVVVITTKKGRSGSSSINYTGEFTYRLKPSYRDYNISNSQEQMGIYKEMQAKGWLEFSRLVNGSTAGLYGQMYTLMNEYDPVIGTYKLPHSEQGMNDYLRQAEFRNTDWFDLLFNNNIMQKHSVSISTGNDKSNLYASLSAMNDPGWYKDSKVELYTANVNASYNLRKNITVTMRASGNHRDQRAPGSLTRKTNSVSGVVSRDFDINPFSFAMNTSRTLSPEETYTRSYAPFNIFKELSSNYEDISQTELKFQGDINYKPILGLEINLLGAYNVSKSTREHNILNQSNQAEAYRAGVDNPNVRDSNPFLYKNPDVTNALPISVMPQGGIFMGNENSMKQLNFRGTVQYNHVWNDTHIFNTLVGMEANRIEYAGKSENVFGVDYNNARNVIIETNFFKQAKEEGTSLNQFSRQWDRRLAYFANVNYSYKGRYSGNVTGRYDGSNQLGKSRSSRWLPTWNVSAAWNAHEEPFFQRWIQQSNGAVTHAALRLSYSLVGEFPPNLATSASALPVYVPGTIWRPQGDQQETGIYRAMSGNSELTYEKKNEFNLGVDLGLLQNRININADFYWRDNFDLLGFVNTQGAGGEISKFANAASMKSHGIEATISTRNIITKDWKWTTDLTFAYTHTEITDLVSYANVIRLVYDSGYNTLVGYPHRSLFSIPFVGLSDDGIPMIINQEGEVTTTDINFQEYDKRDFLKYEGPTEPTMTGGLNNMLSWKNWHLNVFITYSFGNKLRLDPVFSSSYSDMAAMPKEFKNRWVMPGDEKLTDIPVIPSTRQVASIRNLQYAYSAYNYSTARVADGGFIRLKDVSLSYDFEPNLINKIGLTSASLKFDVTNLLLLYADKKLNGQDPEFVNSGGVASPLPRQFTMTIRMGI